MTIFCNINEVKKEENGYTTYVVELLEQDEIQLHGYKYVTCTKFPNWSDPDYGIGTQGYLCFRDIKEGVDKWYDDGILTPYKYTFTQYVKFIPYIKENHEYKF